MKLETGKRYVLRNGQVVGPLTDYNNLDFRFYDANAKDNFGRQLSWRIDGSEQIDRHESMCDIVAEYSEPDQNHIADVGKMVEPQPQQPLRWQENCKPDRPGIWLRIDEKSITGYVVDVGDLHGDEAFDWEIATRCYLGPIPEILPPVKKVIERLCMKPVTDRNAVAGSLYEAEWIAEGTMIHTDWIRTDRTREVER